ncbi:MAG: class I SAM-dependent methyltransferase [Spirochaetaceae bacterium]|nr:MAG: class I SAM-dependent methyltransferase [Spirochaetaceae bacterium]
MASNFYAEISEIYDSMIGSDAFLDELRAQYEVFLRTFRVKTAIDTACGSGYHSIALASSGVVVTACDIAPAMLEKARVNAARHGVEIRFENAAFDRTHRVTRAPVDAVFCMGNSIPHVLHTRALEAAIRSFYRALGDRGIVVIQLLNYDRIAKSGDRIVNIRRDGSDEYVRFYDFLSKTRVRFNVLAIDWSGDKPTHRLYSTELKPYTLEQIIDSLEWVGFTDAAVYASMELAPYDDDASYGATVVARKAGR